MVATRVGRLAASFNLLVMRLAVPHAGNVRQEKLIARTSPGLILDSNSFGREPSVKRDDFAEAPLRASKYVRSNALYQHAN